MSEQVGCRNNLMKAVRHAADGGLFVRSSLSDGLRAVRLFEQINGLTPDMTDSYHRAVIHNTGYHFKLHRELAKIKGNRP